MEVGEEEKRKIEVKSEWVKFKQNKYYQKKLYFKII